MRFILIVFGILLITNLSAQSIIERVEPEFWWAGMADPGLQLLVYGPDIAELQPTITAPGIYLESTVRVENPNYLFLYLRLDVGAPAGTFPIRFEREGELVESRNYELKARQPGAGQGYGPEDVIYLITPDRFANGDLTNDRVARLSEGPNRELPGGRHGGDLRGILDHLDYLEELGVTALWLNPVLENAMPAYSYHGYSTRIFTASTTVSARMRVIGS